MYLIALWKAADAAVATFLVAEEKEKGATCFFFLSYKCQKTEKQT